jgi:L-ascorbate metabolism protein UlaG (beta-lactamase superfamily)
MHITFLGHAQLLLRLGDQHLLLDPWFAEPVFGMAWWRYPPPPVPTAESLPAPVDLLLLSHIHPDHSGSGTLAQMPCDTPTAIMPFPSGMLERRLERAGYTQVRKVAAWDTQELLDGVKVTFVPHDRGWEVSSIVVEANGMRIYHGNDNTLSVEGYSEVRERLGPIDIAFLPFAGASSYPTGFGWEGHALKERCDQKKAQGVARLTDGIEGLRPKRAVPFASSWALLEPSELWKNYLDRPTSAQAAEGAKAIAAEHGTEVLLLEPGDEIGSEGVIRRGLTRGWSYDADSVARYAEQRRADVEAALQIRQSAMGELPDAERLSRAFWTYFEEMLSRTGDTTRRLRMVASFVADGAVDAAWTVLFEPGSPPRLMDGAREDADETLTLDAAELWALLTTSANWEDPWYGYRLRVLKRAGAGYYRGFWEMLLNFDDQELSARVAREV